MKTFILQFDTPNFHFSTIKDNPRLIKVLNKLLMKKKEVMLTNTFIKIYYKNVFPMKGITKNILSVNKNYKQNPNSIKT